MNPVLRWALVVIAVVGLAVDVYTHIDLGPTYAHSSTSITQEQLFYVEAALAGLAALALLVRCTAWTAGAAFLISAGGLALLLIYRYYDVGTIGPIPDMYEPIWYTEKSVTAWFEAVAAVASGALLVLLRVGAHRTTARNAHAT